MSLKVCQISRLFNHLEGKLNRLIVCLKSKSAGKNFLDKDIFRGGTPPFENERLFSPSGATGVKNFKKAPGKKIAFLKRKLGPGSGVGPRFEGVGLEAENKRLKEQLNNLAEIAKNFIHIASIALKSEHTEERDLVLKENLVALEYAIRIAENKAWRSSDE